MALTCSAVVQWHDSPELASDAERLCRELLSRIRATVTRPPLLALGRIVYTLV